LPVPRAVRGSIEAPGANAAAPAAFREIVGPSQVDHSQRSPYIVTLNV